ncbi:hypothetical protein TRICI_000653 [Trichomonascus ciferrii]|uniref:Uncharacterized protein n=1 Tax=Trichomonascus ciferrii TaxID=44093 RepID=A0A642VAR2_9ASCO|nr:hypothetical protein TRICI_000653 [Trichomonascus ciferrii]
MSRLRLQGASPLHPRGSARLQRTLPIASNEASPGGLGRKHYWVRVLQGASPLHPVALRGFIEYNPTSAKPTQGVWGRAPRKHNCDRIALWGGDKLSVCVYKGESFVDGVEESVCVIDGVLVVNEVGDACAVEHVADALVLGHADEEQHDAATDVALDELVEDLDCGRVALGHAAQVDDDVLAHVLVQQAGEAGMDLERAVELETPQPVAQVAGVGEGQRLGDLDDETAGDGLQRVGELVGVAEAGGAGDAAEDLDPGARRVVDDADEGEGDADGDARLHGPEDG